MVRIKDNLLVSSIKNGHSKAKQEFTKSLSYKVIQTKRKLKSEYAHLKGAEIKKLIENIGNDNVTKEAKSTLLGYSGDTPVEDYERWNHTKVLIHEATFLEDQNQREINPKGNYHSTLDEVIRMVSEINVETLILGHFSSRYSTEQIDRNIRKLCKECKIKIPVFRVLPEKIEKDILAGNPINS